MWRPPLTRGRLTVLVLLIVSASVVLVGLAVWLPASRTTALAALVSSVAGCLAALRSNPGGRRRRR
jgi:hypothetical protein